MYFFKVGNLSSLVGVPDTTSIFQDRSCQDVKAFFFNVLWAEVQIALVKTRVILALLHMYSVHSNLVYKLCVYKGIWRRG